MAMKTVLMIDDEENFCSLIKESLEMRSDFDVFVATSGLEGLNIAKRVKPDIILLDIRMPDMDGFKVLEKLKKDKDTMAIPVIMLSALEDDASKIKASQLFDELYITKPVKIEDLQNSITEVLKRRGTSGA